MEGYRGLTTRESSRRESPPAEESPRAASGFFAELTNGLKHPFHTASATVVLEAAALALALAGIVYALAFRTFFVGSGVLVASLVGPSLAIVVASRGLRAQEVGSERIFVGLSSAVSGVWLFEILYHYGWSGTFSSLSANLLTFNIDTGMGNYFPLPWAIIMVVLPAVAYRRMHINATFLLLLLGTLIGFWGWTNAGYPQFTYSGSYAVEGAVYNTVTKLLVCLLPASLFLPFGRIGLLREVRPSADNPARPPSETVVPRARPTVNRRTFE